MTNISKKKWISVSASINNDKAIKFLYTNFSQQILGTHETDDNIVFYFNYNQKNIIKNKNLTDCSIKELKYENWHQGFIEYFKPLEINDQFTIIPEWHKPKKYSEKYIIIKPGMAFGTGTHETTQLILNELQYYISSNDNVLDLGSGSGILAIGAIKCGAKNVDCYDYDVDCETNFYENMKLNSMSNFSFSIKNVLSITNFSYDCIVANINETVLIDLLPIIKKNRNNNSTVILSGIIKSYKNKMISLVEGLNFNLVKCVKKGEWICLVIN